MDKVTLLDRISKGRTDLVFELLRLPDWQALLHEGPVRVLQWFVYYNDVTALKAVLEAGGDLSSLNLNEELGNAAFFGHWKVADFLINHGADVNARISEAGETPLHNALSKAGRPHYFYVVRLLVEHGADVNARTTPGIETGGFMRDVRTKGETPLHRAAAPRRCVRRRRDGSLPHRARRRPRGPRRQRRFAADLGQLPPPPRLGPAGPGLRPTPHHRQTRRTQHQRPRRRLGQRHGTQPARRISAGELRG